MNMKVIIFVALISLVWGGIVKSHVKNGKGKEKNQSEIKLASWLSPYADLDGDKANEKTGLFHKKSTV